MVEKIVVSGFGSSVCGLGFKAARLLGYWPEVALTCKSQRPRLLIPILLSHDRAESITPTFSNIS